MGDDKEIEVVDNPPNSPAVVNHTITAYSGPLPPAEEFARYETILKGSADRILRLAENQSTHRQHIEKWAIIGDQIKSFFGLISAFIIGCVGVAGSLYLVYIGRSLEGLAALFLALGTLLWGYKSGLRKHEESIEETARQTDDKS